MSSGIVNFGQSGLERAAGSFYRAVQVTTWYPR
jgi:hypothetical protein